MSKNKLGHQPPNSGPQRILLICRSSRNKTAGEGTTDNDRLDEHEAQLRKWVSQNVDGSNKIRVLKLKREGGFVDPENGKLLKTLPARGYDLILATGLDCLAHGNNFLKFLKLAARYGVRIVAVADRFDSAKSGWWIAFMMAGLPYTTLVAESARRISRGRRSRR